MGSYHSLAKKLVLFMITLLVIMPFGNAFASQFSDVEGHWAGKQITEWMNQGYIDGYADGSFKPEQEITRGEFMALVNRSFHFRDKASISFSDISPLDWVHGEVSKAVYAGYATGYDDNTIRPDTPISRQEAAVIIERILPVQASQASPNGLSQFKDEESIANWGREAVVSVVSSGIMNGYEDGTFRPEQRITRAETVVVLQRTLEIKAAKADRVYDREGSYGPAEGIEVITGNVTIAAPGATLQNVTIEGDLLLDAKIGEGDVFAHNVTVKGQTIVNGGGENSVHLENSTFTTIIVDKKEGIVRLVAKGSTTAEEVILMSEAKIEQAETGLRRLVISSELPEESRIVLAGMFDEVVVQADRVHIELSGNETKIASLILETIAYISGEGSVEKAVIGEGARGSSFNKRPAVVEGAGKDSIYQITVSPGGFVNKPKPIEKQSVYGSVYDVSKAPIVNAVVTVTDTVYSTKTDQYGKYVFNQLPEGTYTLTVTKDGYLPALSDTVTVVKDKPVQLNFELQQASIDRMVDHIVISAPDVIKYNDFEPQYTQDGVIEPEPIILKAAVYDEDNNLLDGEQVVWSLEFQGERDSWDYDGNPRPYPLTIDAETGELHSGWYTWIEEVDVVARSVSDSKVSVRKTIQFGRDNIKSVTSTNGKMVFQLFGEPDWIVYGNEKYAPEIHSVVIDKFRADENGWNYEEVEINTFIYDPLLHTVQFNFTPFEQTGERQVIVLTVGYEESTHITYSEFIVEPK
ncbi:S-layer homology domain-containing protein [Paenibacillus sp. J2TS4]|uniref:S-layer homology domain-containing protein n=1 Tax=Paenibacillus sp. J2TS4 TaxID=2807194 RepID=UPI001B1487AC|nr:S-layer homology domain-containing protein [Paenibacillus sp. J2TS4]GIP34961.1 hypothetical protein J2TS4_41710 [Paenibacillus sp. J2TS4]